MKPKKVKKTATIWLDKPTDSLTIFITLPKGWRKHVDCDGYMDLRVGGAILKAGNL